MVQDVAERLAEQGITFELTQAAADWLAEEGFDPGLRGAAPAPAIQRSLENRLSRGILSGEFQSGDHLVVNTEDGSLAVTRAEVAVAGGLTRSSQDLCCLGG